MSSQFDIIGSRISALIEEEMSEHETSFKNDSGLFLSVNGMRCEAIELIAWENEEFRFNGSA